MVGTKQGDGLGAGGVTINEGERVMSREIKFRAWNGQRMLFMGTGGYCDFEIAGGDVYVSLHGMGFSKQDYPVMQLTGVGTCQGVDIYAGDIISDHVGIGFVEYVERYAAFRVNYGNGQAKWFYDYSLKGEYESIEVIGNIYESPELLEGGE